MTSQPQQAMLLGNKVRLARCDLRRQLHARDVHIVDVLTNPPWFVGKLRVFDLLEGGPAPRKSSSSVRTQRSSYRCVWTKALNMRAASANVNLFCVVDDLTPRARGWLVAEMRRLYRLDMTAADWAALERPVFPNTRNNGGVHHVGSRS